MSLLLVGMSHRSASVRELERAAVGSADQPKLLTELLGSSHINEAMLLATCNRVEVYVAADTFHGSLNEVTAVLSRHTGVQVDELAGSLYVHYAEAAVQHLLSVASGLDSMVLGESQILGQLRAAYAASEEVGTVGSALHDVVQRALHTGKRVHSETGIDTAGASVVSEALADSEHALGGLAGRRVLLIGAGSMGGLAAAHLRRAGVAEIAVANRTRQRGQQLADLTLADGTPARTTELERLDEELDAADLVVSCTGAVGPVVSADLLSGALERRAGQRRPLVICDLGLPRDVEPLQSVPQELSMIDLASLQRRLVDKAGGEVAERARSIVASEVRAHLEAQRSAAVTPTVAALRSRAAEVVDSELLRLDGKLPELDPKVRGELNQTVRRVVDKLLHTPTVRMKELAAAEGGVGYVDALRELFGLDPGTAAVLSSPEAADPQLAGPRSGAATDYQANGGEVS